MKVSRKQMLLEMIKRGLNFQKGYYDERYQSETGLHTVSPFGNRLPPIAYKDGRKYYQQNK